MSIVQKLVSICVGLIVIFGTFAALDGRYAKAVVVSQVSERLEKKIIQDRMEKIQERMWAMEDRWGAKFMAEKNRIHDSLEELLHFMTPEARDHYRELQKEYGELEKRLEEK